VDEVVRERLRCNRRYCLSWTTCVRQLVSYVLPRSYAVDTFEIRYALRHCELIDYDLFTTFACHNEPTYVLSRNCTNEYYVANGICCKVDDTINYLVNVRADFFKNIKFMLHSDDDTYWRPDQVLRWLAAVDKSGANKYPLIANAQIGDDNNKGVWMIENCLEIRTSGWYQPTMLNHAALDRMKVSSAAYGNKDICNAFQISQDVGVGIYAWMHGVNHVVMPGANVNGEHIGANVFTPTDIAVHYVKHHEKDRCDGKTDNGWPIADRYNQEMVVGCGSVDKSVVGHDKKVRADMYDAWNYYRAQGKDVVLSTPGVNEFIETFVVLNKDGNVEHIVKERTELTKSEGSDTYVVPDDGVMLIDEITTYKPKEGETVAMRVIPRIMPLRGYRDTQHAKDNDITKQWKPFTLQDCSPPGKKQ
jgi:hypothetical protein